MGAFVPITLGGKEFRLAELPRRANRDFQERLKADITDALKHTGPLDTIDEVMDAIAEAAELWMDLLIAYDEVGAEAWNRATVLPERDWIDTTATDRECYESIRKVTGYVFPFGKELMQLVPELRPMLLQAVSRGVAAATVAMVTSSRSMNSAPPSTAGDPTSLSPASPTPSSSPSSRKPRSDASKKRRSR